MANRQGYPQKFLRISGQTPWASLSKAQREFVQEKALEYRFTLQELRQVTEISLDFASWTRSSIIDLWPEIPGPVQFTTDEKKILLRSLREQWLMLRSRPISFDDIDPADKPRPHKPLLIDRGKAKLSLGHCPVASPKTRCCNLLTLDVVENCGFDCSYCSIQSFYHGNKIYFDDQLGSKLNTLRLDPERIYHIGTGQSSDSLMWGNRSGVLDALIGFARRNPNVILELKTKSKNIRYLLEQEIPKNIICTWSLNTDTIIEHEEHLTASLDDRLDAARKAADNGMIVGFHFHPMVHYDRWRQEYAIIFERLQELFEPCEVAMLSFGTLTFIKPVIRQIRHRDLKSKILQMPLVDANGKLSYPVETKLEMFSFAHERLSSWRDRVFFYLCMENPKLWMPVFGYEYRSNEEFEAAMKKSYMNKIDRARAEGPRSQQ